MPPPVKTRPYDSSRRRAAADRTRRAIVIAARELFVHNGFAQTSMAELARSAGVSVDTIYASVGRKPDLLRAVIDDVLGEGRGEVPATQRLSVEEVRAAVGARAKLTAYAAALSRVQPEAAPLTAALRDAGTQDPECAQAWSTLIERRATNMRVLAAELRATGELRPDLDDETVADLLWATNSAEHYLLLASRGWSATRYAVHLADLWIRLLFEEP